MRRHFDLHAAEGERARLAHRNAALSRAGADLLRDGIGIARHPQLVDLDAIEHREEAAGVVGMGMRQDGDVEVGNPQLGQGRNDVARAGIDARGPTQVASGVDQHGVRARELNDGRVALADGEERQRHPLAAARQERNERQRGEGSGGLARRSARQQHHAGVPESARDQTRRGHGHRREWDRGKEMRCAERESRERVRDEPERNQIDHHERRRDGDGGETR